MNKFFIKRIFASVAIVLLTCNLLANKKVALIWGNASYSGSWQSLPVVTNDANTMNRIFISLGFQTKMLHDGNLDQMKSSLREFSSMAKNADIAVFYYSGHATRHNNSYYIIPAKTLLGNDILASDLLPAQDIISSLKNSRMKLLFFDSCRDDTAIEGISKGNPNIVVATDVGPTTNNDTKSPSGTMLCFAAERGMKAYTGSGKLSTFTEVLSKHITDGDEFRTVWANIINDVYLIQKQRPVNDGFYQHDLYLNPGGVKISVPTSAATQSPNNMKSISIISNAPDATIDFYGTKYEAGNPLMFKIGETYTYTISANGYNSYIGELSVTDTSPSTINITMQKNENATLRIFSNTRANIFLDGKYAGTPSETISTKSGTHSLELYAKGYYSYSTSVDLDAGFNSKHITMTRKTPWFFDWDDYGAPVGYLSYHYSPKYQIGLQYLHRCDDSRFLLGANIAVSTGLFRGLEALWGEQTYKVETTADATIDVTYADGSSVTYKNSTTLTSGYADEYSEEIDPYNEAKKYESYFMFLFAGGYNPCNGILLEAGLGVASQCDKVYMPYNYTISKSVTTNMNTGEIGEPEYKYTRNEGSHWYIDKVKWSPAFRLGAKFLIPFNEGDCNILLGGGYTYLPANKKYSSFDVSVGVAWAF